MCVIDIVRDNFVTRQNKVVELIQSYNVDYIEIGIFGSFARNDYKSTSDIDFCIITENRPDRRTSGCLREEAELLGADVIYVTPEYFKYDNSVFAKNLRRDYRRIL